MYGLLALIHCLPVIGILGASGAGVLGRPCPRHETAIVALTSTDGWPLSLYCWARARCSLCSDRTIDSQRRAGPPFVHPSAGNRYCSFH